MEMKPEFFVLLLCLFWENCARTIQLLVHIPEIQLARNRDELPQQIHRPTDLPTEQRTFNGSIELSTTTTIESE